MDVVRDILLDREAALRVLDHPLQIADHRVDDQLRVADAVRWSSGPAVGVLIRP
ncbi:hypothetical protein [Streptomyces syringium]|uniref:hypothetical protein n=1 Tax=Streptomyces syringium TaxID=76729 RepID=UPI0034312959